MPTFLENVAGWQQKADAGELRYYRPSPFAEGVHSGQTPLVLGRKGSGKTALINYIEKAFEDESFFVRLTFNPVLLRGWGRRAADRVLSAPEYEILWTAFIFQEVCKAAVRRGLVTGALKDEISIRHSVVSHRSLSKSLRLLGRSVKSLKVAFTGVTVERGTAPDRLPQYKNDSEWLAFIDECRVDVERIAGSTRLRCIVLCDEIDLRFDPSQDPMQFDDYVNCIKGLLLASAQLAIGRGERSAVAPIIALRSDIFESLSGPELNAWNGRTVRLEPDDETIRDVLRYRISKALPDSGGRVLSFKEAWRKAFSENAGAEPPEDPGGMEAMPPSFVLIWQRTLNRARDYVEFMRLAANHQIKMNPNRKTISGAALTAAYTDFAPFLLSEFKDELFFKYKFGNLIVESFRALYSANPNRQNFHFGDFVAALEDQGVELDDLRMRDLARDLYRTSVIGYQARGPTNWSKAVFRFQSETQQLPPTFWGPDVALTLHRAIRRALNPAA